MHYLAEHEQPVADYDYPAGSLAASGPFRHRIAQSLTDELVGNGELAAAGVDVYFACAEYATPANRTAVNAVCACGFWMDFDCGEEQAAQGKGYADKADVYPELTRFSVDTGLREPTHIVDSGGGLHAYWIVNGPILRDEWMTRNFRI